MNTAGSCPKCGALIYSSNVWMGITPPPAQYTCLCRMGYAPAQQGPAYETRESTTGCAPIAPLTEADVRRIVRDELGKSAQFVDATPELARELMTGRIGKTP